MKKQSMHELISNLNHTNSQGNASFFKSVANAKISNRKKVLQSLFAFIVEMQENNDIRKELAALDNESFKKMQRFSNWIIADYEKNSKFRELDELDYQINWCALRIRYMTYKKKLDVTKETIDARAAEVKNVIQYYRGQTRY